MIRKYLNLEGFSVYWDADTVRKNIIKEVMEVCQTNMNIITVRSYFERLHWINIRLVL